ncbi:MAG TPA: hypothetical protein VFH95_13690 [Candidatus Kapabacteria bacterium]|nr:hypothetical protein [Candidatus Kapabacteria bacterium]
MRQYDQKSEDIQKLEDEIRKLGVPYASETPEPLYWANFRVRVMERVAQKETRANWPARFGQFIAEHVLGAGIAASAACVLVAAILWLQPSGESPQFAAVQQPAAALAPPAMAVQPPLQAVASTPDMTRRTHETHVTHQTHAAAQPSEDLASVAVPLGADDETPVSLQSLTQPELEAVLQSLTTSE